MALSIMYWVNYTAERTKIMRKSENTVNCDRVLRFMFDPETAHVESVVQASMRDLSYRVEIDVNEAFGVDYSKCECPMGNFYCHHVAATLLFGYKRASRTDIKCSWLKKPKSKNKPKTATMEELFPLRKPDYRALNRDFSNSDVNFLFQELDKLGRFTALHWILSPEPKNDKPPALPIEDLIMSHAFLEAGSRKKWLSKALVVSPQTAQRVAVATTGQRNNPTWSVVRRHRITASNFGVILGAIRRNSYPPSLWKRLMSTYNLEKKDSVAWGVNHEEAAIKVYTDLGGVIEQTGIWLHESGMLGASPDGIVITPIQHPGVDQNSPDIIEVKCPYSARTMTVQDAVDKVKNFFLVKVNGRLQLKDSHDYYHQIQGQLYIMDKESCDLIVWTPLETLIMRIYRDLRWGVNINKLKDFYLNRYVPTILA